ncbi:TetR/AcrR family transcriptional regulator [Schleiferilactobacillus perolens]|uniref:TetR family transcriptional regulator n=1 Tax=Schleiferilactobacillus perolens DSM 12744 TaxID=1423792 RepID=A0A0R1N8I5_9LACO|nr:TetR/AcrR family transcriptional regulator [Schleiferilactobacillus perolens]KRL13299.1 TetR family transcriptional regulator [Schleiferilactobacillus perolens DSM 12744]
MALNNVESLFAASLQDSDLSAKQKAVLRASLTLFADKGYDRTSTADIARLAGVSEGTVYKRFKTKRDIFEAITTPFVDQVLPTAAGEFFKEISTAGFPDFRSLLTFAVHDRIVFGLANRRELKIFVQEIVADPQMFNALAARASQLFTKGLAPLFKQFQDTGELVQWDAIRIGRYIISTVLGYVLPSVIARTPEQNVDQATQEIVEFLLKGLHP